MRHNFFNLSKLREALQMHLPILEDYLGELSMIMNMKSR